MPFLVDRGLHHAGLLPVLDVVHEEFVIPEGEVGKVAGNSLHSILAQHLGCVFRVLFILVLDLLE